MVNQSALPPPTISPASRPDTAAPEIPATMRCPVGAGPAFTARSIVMVIVHSGTKVIMSAPVRATAVLAPSRSVLRESGKAGWTMSVSRGFR